uniref:Uncharacterized protein n=1 Tax=Mustela putorius furo TaxID=9669 RepID=M3YED1_MUSPF
VIKASLVQLWKEPKTSHTPLRSRELASCGGGGAREALSTAEPVTSSQGRERAREHKQRERQREKQAPHRAESLIQDSIPGPWDHELY